MHGCGLDFDEKQSEMIMNLLYDQRKGMEEEAGKAASHFHFSRHN